MLDLAECPGERLPVLGNHDRDVPALRRTGFQKTCRTALCATDPPLVLTHIPLLTVPAGATNVHGHLHQAAGPTKRHVNVSVEHTDYAPQADFYVVVRSDSMSSVGYRTGDIIAIKRTPDATEGDVVLVRIGTEITLKCFHGRPRTGSS